MENSSTQKSQSTLSRHSKTGNSYECAHVIFAVSKFHFLTCQIYKLKNFLAFRITEMYINQQLTGECTFGFPGDCAFVCFQLPL